jgi:hypothetical protein
VRGGVARFYHPVYGGPHMDRLHLLEAHAAQGVMGFRVLEGGEGVGQLPLGQADGVRPQPLPLQAPQVLQGKVPCGEPGGVHEEPPGLFGHHLGQGLLGLLPGGAMLLPLELPARSGVYPGELGNPLPLALVVEDASASLTAPLHLPPPPPLAATPKPLHPADGPPLADPARASILAKRSQDHSRLRFTALLPPQVAQGLEARPDHLPALLSGKAAESL